MYRVKGDGTEAEYFLLLDEDFRKLEMHWAAQGIFAQEFTADDGTVYYAGARGF